MLNQNPKRQLQVGQSQGPFAVGSGDPGPCALRCPRYTPQPVRPVAATLPSPCQAQMLTTEGKRVMTGLAPPHRTNFNNSNNSATFPSEACCHAGGGGIPGDQGDSY